AKQHNIPFYVAAPLSTVDLATATGEDIPIEERDAKEVTHIRDYQLTPEGVEVHNFAFDVTPNELIAAIITDRGVARAPYTESLRTLADAHSATAPYLRRPRHHPRHKSNQSFAAARANSGC